MTFTDTPQALPSTPDSGPVAKPRTRQRTARAVVTAPQAIQTRLVPNCAWPTEADALPSRRAKRR